MPSFNSSNNFYFLFKVMIVYELNCIYSYSSFTIYLNKNKINVIKISSDLYILVRIVYLELSLRCVICVIPVPSHTFGNFCFVALRFCLFRDVTVYSCCKLSDNRSKLFFPSCFTTLDIDG